MRTVDQLLFGYRAGHELIAGSLELTAPQLQEIMPHTDASFDGPHEHQLVGAWIDSAQRYLLARVWPAPEGTRPGAVWAHALLIAADDLRAGSLIALPRLLRRPAQRVEGYGVPLAWPDHCPIVRVAPRLGRALVEAATARDRRPRIVLWRPPEQAHAALVALLDVTAPEQRRQLSFRTRERVGGGASRYRVQVAAALRGDAHAAPVIDARTVIARG
jgi:hypothetical protein